MIFGSIGLATRIDVKYRIRSKRVGISKLEEWISQ